MAFELPSLPYAHDALEPNIDARTMEIHHGKHHAGYTANLNAAVSGTALEGQDIETILRGCDMNNKALRNNGGGYYNHNLFWQVMGPNGGAAPEGALAEALTRPLEVLTPSKRPFLKQPKHNLAQDGHGFVLKQMVH